MNDQRGGKAYLWILPAMVCMAVIQFFPGLLSIVMAFTNLDVQYIKQPLAADFVGMRNFLAIFQPGTAIGNGFVTSLWVTLRFTFITTVIGYLLGLGAALMLNRPFRGRTVVRALLIVPWMVPSVVSAYIWRMMFMRDYGVVNKVLTSLGIIDENIFWLLGSRSLFTIIVARLWTSFPFIMISILAALQTISADYYEAATIDGASVWQRFVHITVPGISTVSKVIIILQFIWATGEFTLPYTMFLQTPTVETNLISVLIYQNSFQLWDFGGGAAMSTVMLGIMMLLAGIYMRVGMRSEK